MWKRRKEEEEDYTPKSMPTPPTSADLTKEGIPMSTMPGRSVDPETPRGAALIGKSVIVKGQVLSREDLTVDGEIEGTVELQEHRLTVGLNGKLQASVKAREIVVHGTIHGNVDVGDRIEIRKDAKLVGDIRTARIVIEDGAFLKGNIDIVKTEVPKPAAAAAPRPQAPPPPVPAASVSNADPAKRLPG
jgi:cytoskeletal protein CcmA (bactofilin family)